MRRFMQQLQEEEDAGLSLHRQMQAVLQSLEGQALSNERREPRGGSGDGARNQQLLASSTKVH